MILNDILWFISIFIGFINGLALWKFALWIVEDWERRRRKKFLVLAKFYCNDLLNSIKSLQRFQYRQSGITFQMVQVYIYNFVKPLLNFLRYLNKLSKLEDVS